MKMDDLKKEKTQGLDFQYLGDVLDKKKELGKKYFTPGFGLAGQLFSMVAKHVIKELGPEKGEALLKDAIEEFGLERGKRIAEKVKGENKSLSLKN